MEKKKKLLINSTISTGIIDYWLWDYYYYWFEVNHIHTVCLQVWVTWGTLRYMCDMCRLYDLFKIARHVKRLTVVTVTLLENTTTTINVWPVSSQSELCVQKNKVWQDVWRLLLLLTITLYSFWLHFQSIQIIDYWWLVIEHSVSYV